MIDARTERAEAIFCDALAVTDAAERSEFVNRACAGDADLRAEVEEMLAAQEEGERFFSESHPAVEAPVDIVQTLVNEPALRESVGLEPALEEKLGTRIGPYKLLQKIGEGGCGVVYMAEQEQPVRRRVALKIIKLGMDTKSVIARFEAERQALALMDHPNIARVLDAGATETGRPYFVMELVHGVRVTEYADANNLATSQRLDLFIQVCWAIQHAHQKGVVHRDIKPSNILVTMLDGRPVPKVIDFGIAKAMEEKLTDKTLFTMYGHFIGTPTYMSPEQAQASGMDVDTRSDIYSLGVLLYELLTGRPPFDQEELMAGGIDGMRRTLSDREPHRPSTKLDTFTPAELTMTAHRRHVEPLKLRLALRGDLDWIVMKALEKDRTRRYQTANGLALDVQRYLDNEPILARPPSRLYRLRKLVRRNKIVFAAGSVTAAALLAASGVSTWLLFKERAAWQRAMEAEQQKGRLQKEADVLRMSVANQQKLLEAARLFKRNQMSEADAILDEIANPKAAPEHASMFRAIGDWHALNGRWNKAKERFDVLVQINEFEGAESTMDDIRSAALLVDQGHLESYERFRESLITRYAGTKNPTTAQRVIRECLFTPANDELMSALDSFADTAEQPFRDPKGVRDRAVAVWHSYALALLAYRHGDHERALDWARRMNPSDGDIDSYAFSVRLIAAMALQQLGRTEEARAELEDCRSDIQRAFAPNAPKTSRWLGFWFDRVYVQIHLREATALIEGSPAQGD